jgi:hypothetical protein
VKGNKELTFIMILPLQMFDITQCMSPVYLFIQIQILIGFQPKYSKKKFMEQIKSMLFVFRLANVSFRNSSHQAKNIYARADNNNPPGVAHNRNRY